MIYYIQGKIISKTPTQVVLENNGVAYILDVTINASEKVGSVGESGKLFTYLHMTEEEINLFGFISEGEKDVFKLLLSVPGIGCKVALRILSGSTVDDMYSAILSEDSAFFTSIPGIGKKIAERLVLELKQSVEKLPLVSSGGENIDKDILLSAVEALTVLGYKRRTALVAVNKILQEKRGKISLENIIKEALKRI
jgi:holliday junction DNA helicase RuvA